MADRKGLFPHERRGVRNFKLADFRGEFDPALTSDCRGNQGGALIPDFIALNMVGEGGWDEDAVINPQTHRPYGDMSQDELYRGIEDFATEEGMWQDDDQFFEEDEDEENGDGEDEKISVEAAKVDKDVAQYDDLDNWLSRDEDESEEQFFPTFFEEATSGEENLPLLSKKSPEHSAAPKKLTEKAIRRTRAHGKRNDRHFDKPIRRPPLHRSFSAL